MRRAVLAMLLFFSAAAAAQAPNFTGRWKLDRDLTTADMRWDKTDSMVVTQPRDKVSFEYFDRDARPLGTNTFTTDNIERFWYKTRMERAWARARWQQTRLVVESHVNVDMHGYQYYLGMETWELSRDGKTLINAQRDGKVIVYQKVPHQNPEPRD